MPEMIPLSSSNIAGAGYDQDTRELHVEFVSGAVYVYREVGQDVAEGLISAASAGQYLNRWIKNQYKFRKVA